MKRILYTSAHAETLRGSPRLGERFTPSEHALVTERELGETAFADKDRLVRNYLKHDSRKLCSLDFLLRRMSAQGYSSVLPLGAGHCVLEYLLKNLLQP